MSSPPAVSGRDGAHSRIARHVASADVVRRQTSRKPEVRTASWTRLILLATGLRATAGSCSERRSVTATGYPWSSKRLRRKSRMPQTPILTYR